MSDTNPGAHVFLVDDDAVMLALTGAALEKMGCRVSSASDGAECLERYAELKPDIVLLDVMMPGVDGFTACRRLRAEPGGEFVPVLMMTGLEDSASIDEAYRAGATDFVTKPINYTLLGHRLQYMLRAKRTADELRASEMRLGQAQRIARLGYWEAEADGRLLRWNLQTHEIFALAPDTEVNTFADLVERIRCENARAILDAFTATARDHVPLSFECRTVEAGGELRDLHVEGVPQIGTDARVRIFGTVQDVTERRRAERHIQHLSYYDGVTGLPNRALLRRELGKALNHAQRRRRGVAVLALDVDHFQRVNDTFGFEGGNTLLRAIAERISACIRGGDDMLRAGTEATPAHSLARFGGDEFVIMLADVRKAEEAAGVAARIRAAMDAPFDVAGNEVFVRLSIGISVYPEDGQAQDDLIAHADAALAHAKRQGRDCYQFYTASMNARAFQRLALETSLRKALQAGQFELFYQPKLRARDLMPTGAEALIRWNHPDLGRVSPGEFIPVAEEIGLIVPMGEWVLASACEQVRRWQSQGLANLRCAVNLSAAQFRQPDLAERIGAIIREAGIDPALIELELTESLVMEDARTAVRVLEDLKTLGLTLAIDDFGTGYSSLSYLRKLPIDVLKIDQSFVRELDRDDFTIVATIIEMARGLQLKVVAEGVESQTQAEFLRRRGCDELQGYLFSAPVPAAEFARWLLNHRPAQGAITAA
ncbi:MAG: putative bifunctional diguanylate cyclase/phosphodiesterase [Gammaproteobacteria bacterium]